MDIRGFIAPVVMDIGHIRYQAAVDALAKLRNFLGNEKVKVQRKAERRAQREARNVLDGRANNDQHNDL